MRTRTRKSGIALLLAAATAAAVLTAPNVAQAEQTGIAKQTQAAQAVTTGWTTVFSENFSGPAGSRLDDDWIYDIGTSYPGGAPNWGTGQVETSTDSSKNVFLDGNGKLSIKATRSADGKWTSGRVETARTDFAAPEGGQLKVSASILQPNPVKANGYWPAFWGLGAAARPVAATNWPSIGELDILEAVNGTSNVAHTFHCGVWGQAPCNEPTGIGSGLLPCVGCQNGYHTYSVIIDRTKPGAEEMRYLTDGKVEFTVKESQVGAEIWSAAVHHGFFFILNLAIGGSFPNNACGCDSLATPPSSGGVMSVDFLAIYTKPGA